MGLITKARVGAEWINDFPDEGKPCHQRDISTPDDCAIGFCEEMGKKGHEKVFGNNGEGWWGNDNAWERDFRHPDFGGDSLNWLDDVHFCYYADHGGNFTNIMHIAFASQEDYCLGTSNQWKLGVKRLKWFVLDCCEAVLNTSKSHVSAVWFPPAYGVHMIFGFVGGRDSSVASIGRNFGRKAAKGDVLSYAWLDAGEDAGTPIAMAYGVSRDEAINRREHETINWRDYDVSSANWLAWIWRD